MNDLKWLITDILDMPYIDAGDRIIDGCFALNPYTSTALQGNGEIQYITDYYALEIFIASKTEIMKSAKKVWKALKENGYVVQAPDYTWQVEGKIWLAKLNIIGGNDEQE